MMPEEVKTELPRDNCCKTRGFDGLENSLIGHARMAPKIIKIMDFGTLGVEFQTIGRS